MPAPEQEDMTCLSALHCTSGPSDTSENQQDGVSGPNVE